MDRGAPWLPLLIDCEQAERQRRSLERRLQFARLGAFKPLCDFDWQWPKKIDRLAIEDLLGLEFLPEAPNVVLIGPNGTGKTMLAQNLAHAALLAGHRVRFTTASAMLNDLAAQDSAAALQRRLRHYCRPTLLAIDELGYLAYDARYADLLCEVVTRRYHRRSTLITTSKPFSEWNQVFPNAACVVTIIDRLVHKAEILTIDGDSYRLKEARERAAQKTRAGKQRTPHPCPRFAAPRCSRSGCARSAARASPSCRSPHRTHRAHPDRRQHLICCARQTRCNFRRLGLHQICALSPRR